MARLSGTRHDFLVLSSMKMTKRPRDEEVHYFGFPGSPTACCGCLIPNPFPCGFHNAKNIEAFEMYFSRRIPSAQILVLWTIVLHKPY